MLFQTFISHYQMDCMLCIIKRKLPYSRFRSKDINNNLEKIIHLYSILFDCKNNIYHIYSVWEILFVFSPFNCELICCLLYFLLSPPTVHSAVISLIYSIFCFSIYKIQYSFSYVVYIYHLDEPKKKMIVLFEIIIFCVLTRSQSLYKRRCYA